MVVLELDVDNACPVLSHTVERVTLNAERRQGDVLVADLTGGWRLSVGDAADTLPEFSD
jgi:hypothetical protein